MEEVLIDEATIDAVIVVEVVVLTVNGTDMAIIMKDHHPSVVVIPNVFIPMMIHHRRPRLLIPAARPPCHQHHHHHHIRKIVPRIKMVAIERKSRQNLHCQRTKERSLFLN
jgi:hypothetical protein